jgi:hypothetical protein
MNTSTPQPTKIGRFTIWVILALIALVIVALVLAMARGGTGGGQAPEDPGQNISMSRLQPPSAG